MLDVNVQHINGFPKTLYYGSSTIPTLYEVMLKQNDQYVEVLVDNGADLHPE
jgi:predicted ribosome-associated RNA-binding protein Tma20